MNFRFVCWCVSAFLLITPLTLHAQNYYMQWADTVDNGDFDIGWAVAVDNSNNIVMTGQSDIGPDENYLTIKYDPDGAILWMDTLDNGSFDIAYGIATDDFNNVIVTGTSWIGGNGDAYTVKYDSNGTFLWGDTITYSGTNRAKAVTVDHSNNIIITGYAMIGPNNDMITVKYTPNGTVLWIDTTNTGYDDYGSGVAVDSDNNIIVTGFSTIAGDHDYMTVKYDSNGTMLWADTIDYGGWDVSLAVATDHSDNIIITGRCELTSYEYLTVKYDPDGTMLWADTLTDGHEAYGVAVDSENSVFVTGVGLTGDYLTVKYDSMGTILWMDTLNNGSGDWAYGIAVDTLDNIIVTGTSTIGGNADYYTVKYALIYADSVAIFTPSPCTLIANSTDSTRVISVIIDNAGSKLPGMADSLSYSASLGSFYGNVIENPADTTYYQWYRAGTIPGIDTIWVVCSNCVTVDSAMTEIVLLATRIAEEKDGDHLDSPLFHISPNPFSGRVTISLAGVSEYLSIAEPELNIYDVSGRIVRKFILHPSSFILPVTLEWDGRDEAGNELPSGVYYLKVSAGKYKTTRKLMLLR